GAVRPLALAYGGDDLLAGPGADAGFLVRRQILSDEHALAGNREADVRSAEVALHVGGPDQCTGRMAVRAAGDNDEIAPARHLRLVSRCGRSEPAKRQRERAETFCFDCPGHPYLLCLSRLNPRLRRK